MTIYTPMPTANAKLLRSNPYPGRLIACGLDESEEYFVQALMITVRSTPNRNRLLVDDGRGTVKTEAADESLSGADNPNIIYNGMAEHSGEDFRFYTVSNGRHTDALMGTLRGMGPVRGILDGWSYEDDSAGTARIAGVIRMRGTPLLQLAILRQGRNRTCERDYFARADIPPGFVYALQTYETDGEPPPPYTGMPFLLPLHGTTPKAVAENLWHTLHEKNRLALAVKFISRATGQSMVHLLNTQEKKPSVR